jgi:polyisoprenyl-teichoic acid--peptidoglycan teichoic acid transferase
VSTDIPPSEVDRFMQLALEAKSQPVSTLSLVPPMINTAEPDIRLIQRKVAQAVAASSQPPAAHRAHHKKKAPSTVTGGSIGSMSTGYAANDASDLGAVC